MKKLLAALFFFLSISAANAGVSCSVPFNLTNGTIADASQVMANYNAILSCLANNAAESGANSSITALLGLTKPLNAASGGSTVYRGGVSTNVASAYSITATVPTGFTLTQNYSVVFVANASNSGPVTLSVNGGTATNIYKQTITGPVPLTGSEIQNNQAVVTWYDGTQWEIIAPFAGVNAASFTASAMPSLAAPVNMQLNASAASNQLTIAAVGVNGSTPSALNPILAAFNNAGQAAFATIATTTSFTIGSTSSMGCTTAVLCRLWVELICQTVSSNACSSVVIGASVQSTPANGAAVSVPQCFPLAENNLQSTGSGTGGGTAINTIQTSVASLTSKPIRIVGYVEATWTSGVGWGSPSAVVLFSPGIKKPCEVVQSGYAVSNATTTPTTNTYIITGATITFIPTSAINLFKATGSGWANTVANTSLLNAQIQRGATALGQPVTLGAAGAGALDLSFGLGPVLDAPETVNSTTYAIYVNKSAGSSNPVFEAGTIQIDEIMG